MSTSAPSKYSKTLSTLAAALSLVSLSAMAQERESAPLGIYGGGAFGVGAAQWECGTSCNRATFSGKFFGGKRLTPGLAAEVNYMFFGGLDRANDTATTASTGVAAVRQKMRALSVGINWEVELLNDFTNSLRVGWAFTRKDQNLTRAGGATERVIDYGSAPYFGAGLSYQFARDMRLLSSFDYVVKGHESYYLFGVGGSMEF
ncbi:MAG: hypothetical protein HY019_02790 [Aquabacterium sp.]|uniref:outer membrane beta-barrel protein n=1 Tax=Aquabacterium sp. TaxID=1872578 RepID=UPI0025C672B0|nr:outer membrane beta-barrel protein [Aquabacterium sp.]MBI3380910.1 hypothetical protein [Aquabacterium sp.]